MLSTPSNSHSWLAGDNADARPLFSLALEISRDVDFVKAQANRLADHLARKHGIKLKHAAALEATAALHGARDWNTLRAGLEAVPAKSPPVALAGGALVPITSATLKATMAGLHLAVRRHQPTCALCPQPFRDESEMHRRSTAAGGAEQLCRACFLGEIAGQLAITAPALVEHALVSAKPAPALIIGSR